MILRENLLAGSTYNVSFRGDFVNTFKFPNFSMS